MAALRPGVLFDIDGTLCDTNYLHIHAWRQSFLEAGADVSAARIHRMIGAGSDVLLDDLLGEDASDGVQRAVRDGWRRHFDELQPLIRAFPGAAGLLRYLAASGVPVALASSSEKDDVDVLVEVLGCDDVLAAVTSAGDVEQAKPCPEVFEVAIEQAGIRREGTVVVGDTVWDIEAAGRAGLPCVCVLSGGISRAELEGAGATAVYDDVTALHNQLITSPLAPLLSR
jgi:HAD superfamily hydrolase (TIGR01549 family)